MIIWSAVVPRLVWFFLCFVLSATAQPEQARLAQLAMQSGDYARAASIIREMLRAQPQNNALRMNLAVALTKAGKPAAAIPELEKVTRASPSAAPAWFLLGLAHQQLNEPQKAIAPLREAVHLDPKNGDALLELADAELTTGDARGASRDFAALTEADPHSAKAWEGLGRAYLALSEQLASQLEQQFPDSRYRLALLAPEKEAQLQKPNCAVSPAACAFLSSNWRQTLAIAEQHRTDENLYWAALASGHLASDSLGKLSSFPQSAEMHAVLADSYQRMGKRLEAVEEWRKAVASKPGDRLIQGRLAESLFLAREYPEAERILRALVAEQPENSEWQFHLGNVLLQLNRDEEALPHLVAATTLSPKLLTAQEALGRLYLKLEKPGQAVIHLTKALPLDTGSISFALSSAYRKLGRAEEAKAALARYRLLTGDQPRF